MHTIKHGVTMGRNNKGDEARIQLSNYIEFLENDKQYLSQTVFEESSIKELVGAPKAIEKSGKISSTIRSVNKHDQETYKLVVPSLNYDKNIGRYGCVRGVVSGQSSKNTFYKIVQCGKENCFCCGADYSFTHTRRILSFYPKLMAMESGGWGYMVITVPAQLRDQFKNKIVLSDFRNFIRRKLKRQTKYFEFAYKAKDGKRKLERKYAAAGLRGLMRYHWAGDDLATWKPHMNIIMEKKHLPELYLRQLKNDLGEYFLRKFKCKCVPNIYYAFTNEPDKAKHWLNYVTRPTAKKMRDIEALKTIKGYINTYHYGKFEKSEILATCDESQIVRGICPDTKENIVWDGYKRASDFFAQKRSDIVELAAGFYKCAKVPLKTAYEIFVENNNPRAFLCDG